MASLGGDDLPPGCSMLLADLHHANITATGALCSIRLINLPTDLQSDRSGSSRDSPPATAVLYRRPERSCTHHDHSLFNKKLFPSTPGQSPLRFVELLPVSYWDCRAPAANRRANPTALRKLVGDFDVSLQHGCGFPSARKS